MIYATVINGSTLVNGAELPGPDVPTSALTDDTGNEAHSDVSVSDTTAHADMDGGTVAHSDISLSDVSMAHSVSVPSATAHSEPNHVPWNDDE